MERRPPMSDEDLSLPAQAILDTKTGQFGGRYVFLICPVCGKISRYRLSWYRARMEKSPAPVCCSAKCKSEYQRSKRGGAGGNLV
jgi:hypothetical protein